MPTTALLVTLAGCQAPRYREQVDAAFGKPEVTTAKAPTKTQDMQKLPVKGAIRDIRRFQIHDARGVPIAEITASQMRLGDDSGNVVGTLLDGAATLFDKGEPAMSMKADTLNADRKSQFVTAKGNVVAQTLSPKSGMQTLRADRMTWDIKKNEVTGSGNVEFREAPGTVISAESFVADLKMERVRLRGGHGKSDYNL